MVEKLRWVGFVCVVLAGAGGLFAFETHTSQAAFVVLDAAKILQEMTGGSRIPAGWQLKVNAGQPDITVSDHDETVALRFKSVKASFGLEKAVNIDPAQLPYLHWDWMVTQLPPRGDFRHISTDDEAAQVMVAFDDRHIISYIWDSTVPEGTMASASFIPLVHIFDVVCRSGSADENRWLREVRNIAEDYRKAYGKPAPHVKGLRLQINSQHTASSAESFFGEVVFRNAQL